MHHLRRVVAVLFALLAVVANAAPTALERLGNYLGPLESMRAGFSQTVFDEDGAPLQSSEGQMAVKRSDNLRWEVESPFAYLVVTDGETLWRYDADLEQATRQPFTGELADTPALIFGGDLQRIGRSYEVSWEQGSEGEWFTLVPRADNALFRSLALQFTNGAVTRLELRDSLDQRTEIRFHSVQVNPTLERSLFSFQPPAGVDVVSDEP
jgi:outer membrane lipoprotein carrier protein